MIRPRRCLARAALGAMGVVLVAAASLAVLHAKERDNRFCVSCHLHQEKFDRFTASAATDLAGAHQVKDPRVGCIACHGGADAGMRLRVWALAAMDTAKYLASLHEEPTSMRLPLREAECRQCHTPILKVSAPAGPSLQAMSPVVPSPAGRAGSSEEAGYAVEAQTEGRTGTSYHALRDHDGVKIRCVRCHTSHTIGSDAPNRFISRAIVQPICRECHRHL